MACVVTLIMPERWDHISATFVIAKHRHFRGLVGFNCPVSGALPKIRRRLWFVRAVPNRVAEARLRVLARTEAHILANAKIYTPAVAVPCIAAY